ncbi:MAG: hypothetical protein L6408_02980 [Nanoarchaeota archaeon]|nr:hypothetical protein [Nanoarchaeota archaeon]
MGKLPIKVYGEFYVSIIYDNIEFVSAEKANSIDEIADKYQCIGRGDPRLGLLRNTPTPKGHYAYTFRGVEKATKFSNEVLGLEYILEVRIGFLKSSLPRSD